MRTASTLIVNLTLAILCTLLATPSAGAQPYPACSPTVDADCYFLWAVHDEFPRVTNSDADLIAGGQAACNWMLRAKSPTALVDWVQAHGREHPEYNSPGDEGMSDFALLFATNAATAYCPNILNEKNPAHW